MGVGVLYGAILGIIILICSPLSYYILNKNGKRKAGIITATVLALIVLVPLFSIATAGEFYTKSAAKDDLKLANLKLNDDFEIISNKVEGMPERFQYTKLKLTKNDRNRIITEIKNGVNFKNSSETEILKEEMWSEKSKRNTIVYTDYFYNNDYVRESYYRKDDYVPILMTVYLNENSDTLTLSRIED